MVSIRSLARAFADFQLLHYGQVRHYHTHLHTGSATTWDQPFIKRKQHHDQSDTRCLLILLVHAVLDTCMKQAGNNTFIALVE